MDEATILKTAIEAGGLVLLAIIVWQFIGVLRLAMTSQASAYESLRQWFTSELNQRDAAIRIEKAERMKLESRFDEQCEETERLKMRILELEEQIKAKNDEIERLKEAIKQLRTSDEKKDERIKEQNDRIRDLERELREVKQQRDDLVKRLDDLIAEKDKKNGKDRKEKKIDDKIELRAEEEDKE